MFSYFYVYVYETKNVKKAQKFVYYNIYLQYLIQKTVNLKKLEKADAKRKQKNEKREKIEDAEETLVGPTTNQVIQKRDMKSEELGKVIDIRIENFDLAFGSK